jgi:hypothetical protein
MRLPLLVGVAALAIALGIGAWTYVDNSDEPAVAPVRDPIRLRSEPYPLINALAVPIAGSEDVTQGVTVPLEGSFVGAREGDALLVNVTAIGSAEAGVISVFPCGSEPSDVATLDFEPGRSISRQIVATLGVGGRACIDVSAEVHLIAETIGSIAAPGFAAVVPAVRLLDTRPSAVTVDEQFAGDGPLTAGASIVLPVVGRTSADPFGMVALAIETTGQDAAGRVAVHPCDGARDDAVDVRAGVTVARQVIVPLGASGTLCLSSTATTDLIVELTGAFASNLARPYEEPVRIVDTRNTGSTVDARFEGIGVRPTSSTLEVPLTSRIGRFDGLVGVVLELGAYDPLEDGELTVFAPESSPDQTGSLQYRAGTTETTTVAVPIGPSGEICVSNTGRADLVVDVTGLLTAPTVPDRTTVPTSSSSARCPQQGLFPERRMVAIYGTDRTPRLGVLGEQDAAAAADRLAAIAEPWRAGDRPVLPAFELIVTLATSDAGADGLHRLRSSPEVVQRYLDVARRHGYYLILDIQPGWSDFLAEVKYWEEFLREPDVGLALDPEWHTQPPRPPAGGYVGQTNAAEVNAVTEWLAGVVEEEDLPEKLLVVHQFQDRMILNRDQLVEPPGIALTIHMDGFGSRVLKLDTWSKLKVAPPWSNGLKLFFDEDIDMYRPDEILAGAFEPVPDLVTYQ